MAGLLAGSTSSTDQIKSDPLTFTTVAGISGVVGAVLAAMAAVVEKVTSWNLNDTQFLGVNTSATDGNFGKVTSTYDPRVLQLGAKFSF